MGWQAIQQALYLFQEIHLKWREVDRSDPSGTSYKDQLVYCQLPIAPSED